MAATSMRIPGKHQTPLKTLNRGNNFLRPHRTANTGGYRERPQPGPQQRLWQHAHASAAKRKSAVELLQESKAFYVKSETVLDRQQQLKHAGHLQVTSSAVDTVFLRGPRLRPDPAPAAADHRHINPHVLLLSPSASPALSTRPAPSPAPPPAPAPTPAPTQTPAEPAVSPAPVPAPAPVQTSAPAAPSAPAPTPAPTPAPAPAPPPRPPKSPRLVSAAQRRAGSHHSAGSDQLQIKLRRLLNADSKENLFLGDAWRDEDAKTVAGDERPFSRSVSCPRSPAGCSIHKSLPDLHSTAPASPTASTHVSDAHSASSRHGRRSRDSAMSTVSSGGRAHRSLTDCISRPGTVLSQHTVHTKAVSFHTTQNGIQSPENTKTGQSDWRVHTQKHRRGSERNEDICETLPSTGSFSDSGAEDVSSPQPLRSATENYCADRRRPILRSKSDISHRYSRANQMPTAWPQPAEPPSSEQLERFFEQLGLDASDYRSLSVPAPGVSSPVFLESVSSVDSAEAWGPGSGGTSGNHQRPSEQLSIVERNARIIKWLCNCRKAQLAAHTSS